MPLIYIAPFQNVPKVDLTANDTSFSLTFYALNYSYLIDLPLIGYSTGTSSLDMLLSTNMTLSTNAFSLNFVDTAMTDNVVLTTLDSVSAASLTTFAANSTGDTDVTDNVVLANVEQLPINALFLLNFSQILVTEYNPLALNVVFLSSMDTSISDVKGHAITTVGTIPLSAAAARFGATGLDASAGSGYLTTAGSADFVFPAAFTVEYWVKFTSSSAQYPTMLSVGQYTAGILIRNNAGDGLYINGANLGSPGIPYDSQWHHVALTRDLSNVCRLFVDGVVKISSTVSGTINSGSGGLTLCASSHALSERMLGYMDEIRITKDTARYTANFTVPTTAFTQ